MCVIKYSAVCVCLFTGGFGCVCACVFVCVFSVCDGLSLVVHGSCVRLGMCLCVCSRFVCVCRRL